VERGSPAAPGVTPPSPCSASTMIAQTSGPMARSTAWRRRRERGSPVRASPKPSRYFAVPVIESAPRLRAVKRVVESDDALAARFAAPDRSDAAQSLRSASFASVPELQKKARSNPVRRHSSSASRMFGSL
jgi:hypothetical protein